MSAAVFDPTTGNWTDQQTVSSDVPQTGDNGYDYGKGIIDLFKFGVGAYLANDLSKFEDKNQYNAAAGGLYKNGQYAGSSYAPHGGMNLPLIIGLGIAVVAVIFLVRD